ncbi:unnamed protein product [Microthlaspi erraticum]|uniref:Cytochrome P450 n=1 Tax=Microthlaspi erraticum TaxID=1685480 RepID=A0A6D2HP77_9BRAS|nr:unnamed protein product [Microthlaspi erraticum]
MAAMFTLDFQTCSIFIVLCLFSTIFYYLFLVRKTKVGCNLPPSPPSLPIIGHLHHILSLLIHKSLQKLSSKYGPILYLRVFNVPMVLVTSASIAYEIFRAQDLNVSVRALPTNEGSIFFGPSGFLTAPYGDYLKFAKKILVTKLLRPQALQRSRCDREDEINRFYSSLLDKTMKKESVDVGEEAMKLINNIICKILIGRSCSEENGEAETVRGLVTESDLLSKKFILSAILRKPLNMIGISLFKKELTSISRRYDEVLETFIVEHEEKRRENHHHQGDNMVDVLLEFYGDENAEFNITRNHIKGLFVDLLIAGTDTSTHAIQWTMAEIINNPNVLEKLREEIDFVVGKVRLIQETDLPNLPYLQAVVKEGLRMHTPAPILFRTFQEKCEINGFHIPEKTTLILNSYAIMRDPNFWEDPEEFKPERFQEEETREEVLRYLPFGSGRKGCPGTSLAYVSVEHAIGVMVQCFGWKIKGDKVNMDEAPGSVTLTMAHPLKCTPVPRTQIPLRL